MDCCFVVMIVGDIFNGGEEKLDDTVEDEPNKGLFNDVDFIIVFNNFEDGVIVEEEVDDVEDDDRVDAGGDDDVEDDGDED
jgi:hypothetical protein